MSIFNIQFIYHNAKAIGFKIIEKSSSHLDLSLLIETVNSIRTILSKNLPCLQMPASFPISAAHAASSLSCCIEILHILITERQQQSPLSSIERSMLSLLSTDLKKTIEDESRARAYIYQPPDYYEPTDISVYKGVALENFLGKDLLTVIEKSVGFTNSLTSEPVSIRSASSRQPVEKKRGSKRKSEKEEAFSSKRMFEETVPTSHLPSLLEDIPENFASDDEDVSASHAVINSGSKGESTDSALEVEPSLIISQPKASLSSIKEPFSQDLVNILTPQHIIFGSPQMLLPHITFPEMPFESTKCASFSLRTTHVNQQRKDASQRIMLTISYKNLSIENRMQQLIRLITIIKKILSSEIQVLVNDYSPTKHLNIGPGGSQHLFKLLYMMKIMSVKIVEPFCSSIGSSYEALKNKFYHVQQQLQLSCAKKLLSSLLADHTTRSANKQVQQCQKRLEAFITTPQAIFVKKIKFSPQDILYSPAQILIKDIVWPTNIDPQNNFTSFSLKYEHTSKAISFVHIGQKLLANEGKRDQIEKTMVSIRNILIQLTTKKLVPSLFLDEGFIDLEIEASLNPRDHLFFILLFVIKVIFGHTLNDPNWYSYDNLIETLRILQADLEKECEKVIHNRYY